MKTLHYSIIVTSFALVLILPSTAFATMLYNNNEVLKQLNTNSTRMTKLVHDGAILITTQTMKKTEYKLGEKIIVHPTLKNIGNESMNILYMWHPFFFVINDQNDSAVWANGPSVPMMEYSSNRNQTIEPNMSFISGIHDVDDPRHPVMLDNSGNYTIFSVADFYDDQGNPRHLVWSEPIKFTILPEKYSVADMNMLPPLQQFLAGIPATSVKCGDGLDLLIKTNTGLPVCIKHNSVTKLVERGWAKKAPSQIPVVIMPPSFDDPNSGKTYDPSSITVVIGINNTVRWTNKASTPDTLTSDGFKESNSFGEIFGGSTISPGDTYEFTFTKSGTFGYHGVPHSWNKGIVVVLSTVNDTNHILSVRPESQNPFMTDKDGKVDLSQIHLPSNNYGQIDYDMIGYLASENKFKKMLEQLDIKYADNNFLLLTGESLLSYPPFTGYCGYVMDDNKEEHWFSSSFHRDTLTSYKISRYNPEPCKPGFASCFCNLQTKIAENNLKQLSYFSKSEEETVGEAMVQYLDKTKVVNVSNEFSVGKYNLQVDPLLVHYCGKFTWGEQLQYFEGYVKDSNVVFFELAPEQQKLCAINADAKIFSFEYKENGSVK